MDFGESKNTNAKSNISWRLGWERHGPSDAESLFGVWRSRRTSQNTGNHSRAIEKRMLGFGRSNNKIFCVLLGTTKRTTRRIKNPSGVHQADR